MVFPWEVWQFLCLGSFESGKEYLEDNYLVVGNVGCRLNISQWYETREGKCHVLEHIKKGWGVTQRDGDKKRSPKQFLRSFKERSSPEHSEVMPTCPKTCSLPFAGFPSQIPVLVMPIACQPSRYILHLCSYLRLASSPTFLPSLIICFLQFSDTWSTLMCQVLEYCVFALSRPLHIKSVLCSFEIKFSEFNYLLGLPHLHDFLTKQLEKRVHDFHNFSVCQWITPHAMHHIQYV